jgi:EAL domain-containing protein (putative c-di-GMP-specific phosphodiesterase class I)
MTAEKSHSAFHLPYNQSPHFWLAVFSAGPHKALEAALVSVGMKIVPSSDYTYVMHVPSPWDVVWKKVRDILDQHDALDKVQVALVPSIQEPTQQEFTFSRKPPVALDALAGSLWLGQAMIDDKLVCYMQPVLDKRGKVFGYEAFARVETDKDPIGGGKIIKASRDLNAEYVLDRHLHVKAITSFISSDLEGFLFINLVPGFIHRPEKYLEGLTDSARFHGMPSKQIVLDFTQTESPHDIMHLKAIFDFCRSKGYSLSLDDIASVSMAKKILETIRPDFIKLDIDLVRTATGATEQRTISELVGLAHTSGATVLAEGVETEVIHNELLKAGVDLFQGYLFSPPVAVSALKKVAG